MKFLTTIFAALFLMTTAANANPTIDSRLLESYNGPVTDNVAKYVGKKYNDVSRKVKNWSVGPRPGKWCGWWMRTVFGGGPEFNLARNWVKRGSNAGGPQVGAVVVWPHHVGYITGKASNGWVVKSGNDGGRVRERVRSVAGAIGFRIL